MAEDMLLFWASGSPPCWRVMIALEEKNLQGYKNKLLSFDKQEHKNPEVLQINPRGQIPTFKHGDVVVNESIAACLYLQNRFKSQGTQLMPDSESQQALVLQRMLEAEALQKKIYDVLFYEYYVPEAERHESARKRNRENLANELKLWESYLQQMGKGSYLTGKDFSLADVAMFPDLAYLPRFGLRKERYPRLMEYYEMVKERPSVKASWPPTWREKEKEQDTLKDL
ncbi:glutathione S-transferase rho isoform X1 [Astyanax mexicanus]|uniref:glutathione S-transferase rho isoform X1 n=1 Tax=Astyanax mexicanus TaxID=7994 RepID=UPI0020CAE36B|nr:glutathione S-transferase rho isoform X1 [Astyanax mexicanus]